MSNPVGDNVDDIKVGELLQENSSGDKKTVRHRTAPSKMEDEDVEEVLSTFLLYRQIEASRICKLGTSLMQIG